MTATALKVGSELTPVVTQPISRYTLAMFAGGSGDHNPMHIDTDFAHSFGMPDVFAHGMLSMAYLAQVLTRSFDQAPQVFELDARGWASGLVLVTVEQGDGARFTWKVFIER